MGGIGRAGLVMKVQIAFGVPFGTEPTEGEWVDVTEHVRGASPMTFRWGRQGWSGPIASSLSLQLKNPTGDFTPANTDSIYYPNVRHGTRVRLSVDVTIPAGGLLFTNNGDGTATVTGPTGFAFDRGNGTVLFLLGAFVANGDGTATYTGSDETVTVDLFDGPIYSWRAAWEDGVYGAASIEAADVLGRLGATTPLEAMLYEEIQKDLGTGNTGTFYPFNDAGPTFGDIRNVLPPLTAYAGSGAPDVAYQTVTGCADQSVVGVGLGGFFSYVGGVGFGFSGGEAAYLFFATSFTGYAAGLLNDSDDDLYVGIDVNGYATDGTTSGPFVADGAVHLLVIVDGDGWYIDGVKYGGDIGIDTVNAIGFNFVGTLFCFGVFYTPPSISRFNEYLQCARTNFAGEATDRHMERLLGYRLNLGSDLDSGLGRIGVHPTDGVSLQQALYDTAQAEGSVVFANGQGRVRFRSRAAMFDTAPVWILDGSARQIAPSTTFEDTTERVVNRAVVSRVGGGASQVYQDDASIAADGVYEYPDGLSLLVDTDAAALACAKWRVQVGTQEQTAATQLDVNLYTMPNANVALALLQLQPLDVVRLDHTSDTAPTTEEFMVQGGSLTLGANGLDVSMFTTVVPAGDPY